jgi:hypothetical protein
MKTLSRLKFVFYIVCWFPLVNATAAELTNDTIPRVKELTLKGGIWNMGSVDELYSFQRYSGHGVLAGVTFRIKSARSQHHLSINYARVTRIPANTSINSQTYLDETRYLGFTSIMLDVNYSYLREICSRKIRVFASANWINSLNYTLDENPELVFSSLALGLTVHYNLKKHGLDIELSAPLLSLTLRDPYHISQAQTNEDYSAFQYIKDNAQVQSLGGLRIIYARLDYRYTITRHFSAGFQYEFRYISDTEPRKLRSASGLYTIGLTYTF